MGDGAAQRSLGLHDDDDDDVHAKSFHYGKTEKKIDLKFYGTHAYLQCCMGIAVASVHVSVCKCLHGKMVS